MYANRIGKRIGTMVLPVLLAALILIIGWASLPAGVQAGEDQPAAYFYPLPPPTTPVSAPVGAADERWLELVRQRRTQEGDSPEASFTININLTTSELAGTAPGLQPISAWVLRDGYQVASGEADPIPDPGGNFYQVDLYWVDYPCYISCGINYIVPGDQVWVSQAGTEISMTVPVLNALAEPQDDRLHGEAPPSEVLTAYVFPAADPGAVYTATGSSDPAGSYQIDLSIAPGLHRQDTGYVLVEPEPDHRVYVYWVAPFLRAQVGGAVLSGMSHPFAEVLITVTLLSGGDPIILQGYCEGDGKFEIDFTYASYPPDTAVSLHPGDKLLAKSSGQVFSMTLPLLSAAANQAGSLVSGQAPGGVDLEIRNYTGPVMDAEMPIWESQPAMVVPATASPSGEYSAALPLETGNYGGAFLTLPDENLVYARYAIPFVHALMDAGGQYADSPPLAGQVSDPLVPITVTFEGPSGYLKDWLAWRSGNAGEFSLYAGSFYLVILPGDKIRITSLAGEEISLDMPELTAEASQPLATVSGTAPPNTRLTTVAHNVYPPYPASSPEPSGDGGGSPPEATLVVTATQAGEYLADFSSLVDFNDYSYGEVSFTNGQGYRVGRAWRLGGCPPSLETAQVGGNRLMVHIQSYCPDASLRLADAQGNEKFASEYLYGREWIDLYTLDGAPIPVLPGDRIQISANGETREYEVPRLTIEIDPLTYQVRGQAPPGRQLEIAVESFSYNGPIPTSVIVTATQAGTYSADLLEVNGYHAGDTLRAELLDSPVEYSAIAVLPRLRVELYDWQVNAWLSPLSAYSLTLTSPITTGQNTGYTPSDGGIHTRIYSYYYDEIQVTPGSRLRLESAGVATELDVPLLTAIVDLETARVSGQAPPGAALRLDFTVYGQDGSVYITQELTAGGDGHFSLDFPELAPVDSAYGSLTYIDAAGHEATLPFQSPYLTVTLEEACVEGYGPNPGGEITLVLTSADGSYSQSSTGSSAFYGAWFNLCFDRPVHAGDRLELSAGGETILTYTAQALAARHNFALGAVEGQAPPGSSPEVIFLDVQGNEISRRPWLNPDGSFGMDTSDLNLVIGTTGKLVVVDKYGSSTITWFKVTGYQSFLPIVYQE